MTLILNLLDVSQGYGCLLVTLDDLAHDTPLGGVTVDFATFTSLTLRFKFASKSRTHHWQLLPELLLHLQVLDSVLPEPPV